VTRRTNARIAGFTFLFYIAVGITSLAVPPRAGARDVVSVLVSLSALVLGVTLYALTRDEDQDLALLALTCRVIEAVPGRETSAIFFAVASTLFSWLFLRGRMIPIALARLGVVASILLVVILVLQRAGLFAVANNWFSSATWLVWLPMLVFEVTLSLWLIVKGVAMPRRSSRQ